METPLNVKNVHNGTAKKIQLKEKKIDCDAAPNSILGPYLPLQEAEYCRGSIVPFERERPRVHREHAVQVTENHVG